MNCITLCNELVQKGKGSLYKRWTAQNSSYTLYKWKGVMYNKNEASTMIGFKKNKVITKFKYSL